MGGRASVSSEKGKHRNLDDLHNALARTILKMRLLHWLDPVVLNVDDPVQVFHDTCVHTRIPLESFYATISRAVLPSIAQPRPQLVIPETVQAPSAFSHMNGPPESPWQVSAPLSDFAQNMLFVNIFLYVLKYNFSRVSEKKKTYLWHFS